MQSQSQSPMNLNTGSFNDKSPQILSSFVTNIQKGKEVAPIGTIKEMGGRNYIKTVEGWKYHGKGTGSKAQEHGESTGVAVKTEGGGSHIPTMADLTPTEKNYLATNFKHNSDEIQAKESEMIDNLQRKGVLEHISGERYKIHSNLLKPVKTQKEESMTDEEHLENAQNKMSDYQDMVDTFLQVPNTNILVYGSGGTGKTYNMVKSIGSQGLVKFEPGMEEGSDEYDVRIVSSKVTPAELYKLLYLNRKKQIVFDDVTSIFESDDSLELLKHALDTGDDALVQWNSSKKIYHEVGSDPEDPDYVKIALPKAFKFTGQAAIITNKAAEEFSNDPHLRALKTRCWSKNLQMSKKETAAMIGSILDHVNYKGLETFGNLSPEQTQQEKRDIFGLLKDNLDEISEDKLSMRAMRSLIAQKRILESKGKPWKEAVTRQLLEKGIWSEEILKAFETLGINLNNDVIEKGGEGSRGGKVIGRTKSGKPVYGDRGAIGSGGINTYHDFTKEDHEDAASLHQTKFLEESVNKVKANDHLIFANSHIKNSKEKE